MFREVVKFVVIVMLNTETQNSDYFSVCHSWWIFDVLNRHRCTCVYRLRSNRNS